MKKILVLTMMVLLACSMSVMASDVTISGETLFEWFGDFDSEYQFNGDVELVVKAVVDDYNTANVDFDVDQSDNSVVLDRGYFTTALGKYLGLGEMGVTITVDWGWNEFDDPSYGQITHYELEDIWEAKFEYWGVGIDVGIMDIIHIEFAGAPEPGAGEMFFGAYTGGAAEPVMAQVYFYDEGNELAKGNVGLAVAFGMDVMPGMFAFEAAANFAYDMDEDIEADDNNLLTQKYAWSFAVATDIMEMAYFDAAVWGWDDSMLAGLFFNVGAAYMDMVGADIGVGMILDEDVLPEAFDELEASVWTKVGAAKFRFGYLLHADQKGAANFYTGVYAPSDGDYNYMAAENGVVFISGELDY